MKNFGDPQFEYHKAMTQIWSLMAYFLSTEPILPFNMSDVGVELETALEGVRQLVYNTNSSQLSQFDFSGFQRSIDLFCDSAFYLNYEIGVENQTSYSLNDTLSQFVDIINSKLYLAERKFLNMSGLPTRPWMRSMLQGPGFLF